MSKVSKQSVNYQRATRMSLWPSFLRRECGTCSMFRGPASCTLVAGPIRRQDVCDRWERK